MRPAAPAAPAEPAVPTVPSLGAAAGAKAPPAAPAAQPGPTLTVICPDCQTRYKVPVSSVAKRFRCKKCQAILEIPPEAANP